jgi:hypothetical protein
MTLRFKTTMRKLVISTSILLTIAFMVLGCNSGSSGGGGTHTVTISGLSPMSGAVGTAVTISGANFGSSQGTSTVTFNGTAGTPTSWSASSIVVPVPSGATTGAVVVTVGGVASNALTFTVGSTPSISSLNPTSGAVATSVTIAGTNFGASQGSSTVAFNGTAGAPTSWSATSIVVPVPSGATTGNVVVTVGGVASNGVTFTVNANAPSITSLNPTSGTVGTSVTITGTNFGASQGSSTVTFNGTAATPTGWSATSIVVPVPSAATTGNVVVTVGGVASNGVAFTLASGPSITSLNPTSGAVGSSLTIAGTNFGASQGSSTVTFNGTAGTPTSWSATSIAIVVPSGATTGNVVVTVGGVASNGVNFSVTPHIASLNPTSGSVGTSVTITGTGFGTSQGSSTVSFNGTTGGPTSWSATSIVVPAPGGATTGNVVVTVGGVASNGVTFTVGTPTITTLSPTSGPVGTSVTISGANFGSSQGSSTVTFNGTSATPTSWGATSIVVPVPSGATSGNVVVTVNGVASNGVTFTVTSAGPTISGLSQNSGAVGTSITITGTNFGASQGTSTVTFNGTPGSPSSWSATSITVAVPSGATTGNVVVTVGGVASNGVNFTVGTGSAPSIINLSPNAGPSGTPVTITGVNFGSSQGSSTVTFNGTNARATSWTATSILVTVPSGATTGNVEVTVGGIASNGLEFTVGSGTAPSFTLIQHPQTLGSTCSTTVANCTLSVAPTGSGHFGVVMITLLSASNTWVTAVTDNQGGSWTVPGNTGSGGCYQFAGPYGTTGCAYNLTLPAGVTSITATWSSVVPEGARMDFREYSYTGGSVALDNIGTFADPTNPVTTIVGVTPVLSGSNDVIIQSFASGSGAATAVTTYADANIGVSYFGSADLLNTTTTVAPTFTICCANTVYAAIYIAFRIN